MEAEQIYVYVAQPVSTDKVAFEWRLESDDSVEHEVVEPLLRNVLRRGVPLPPCARQTKVDVPNLEQVAQRAVPRAREVLFEKLGKDDVEVTCQYLGVATSNGVDRNAPMHGQSKVVFKWTLRTSEWEWTEEVSLFVKHVGDRDVIAADDTHEPVHH